MADTKRPYPTRGEGLQPRDAANVALSFVTPPWAGK